MLQALIYYAHYPRPRFSLLFMSTRHMCRIPAVARHRLYQSLFRAWSLLRDYNFFHTLLCTIRTLAPVHLLSGRCPVESMNIIFSGTCCRPLPFTWFCRQYFLSFWTKTRLEISGDVSNLPVCFGLRLFTNRLCPSRLGETGRVDRKPYTMESDTLRMCETSCNLTP